MTDPVDPAAIAQALRTAAAAPDAARVISRLPITLWLDVGGDRLHLATKASDVGAPDVEKPDTRMPEVGVPEVGVQGPLSVWQTCLGAVPPAGFQSVGALMRSQPDFRIVGDPLAIAQCLGLLETVVDGAREILADGAATTMPRQGGADAAPAQVESLGRIQGRYLQVNLPEIGSTWLYEESTGDAGKPVMLMLHTAGADARQWHALMTDERLLADWRMLAFDMPFHGRSSPPLHWRGDPWRLDTRLYLQTLDAYLDAAGVERAAILGCSMGSAAGLAFLAERPARAHGAILLEAPFRSPGRRSPFLDHPAVHAGRMSAAWVQALLSPGSPAGRRRRATWIYGQGGPGVYEGDLGFYSDEFDAADYVGRIDTRVTPLWLLTGEYDYSATVADSSRLADAIPGAQFQALPDLGHFPMVENPAALLTTLHPIAAAMARAIAD